jgi:hypothetical protein
MIQSGMKIMHSGVKAKPKNQLKKVGLAFVAVLAVMCAATSANASCGPTIGMKPAVFRMPLLATAGLGQEEEGTPSANSPNSIVGLWHTMYTAGGSPFVETLKQWHSDGTEFENANRNPATGSICLGVWKQVSVRTVHLHHLGFLFTADGAPDGTFTVDEIDTVAVKGMSYSGTFTFRVYDVNGVFTGVEVTGTIAATRITVD